MVMDATQTPQPSPQSVGREFVRQYYTLMNKAPNHLHRFYNNNSSFIHGESTTVIGQKNIHYRIQQLNLNDCHAKISQVDSQATLGNGVVVQVTGELSNDGQPMRLFTQTFVLAAQSPKKYYVHNDIFRYQDVYSDDENDVDERSDTAEERVPTPIQSVVPNDQHAQGTQIGSVVMPDQQPQIASQVIAAGGAGGGASVTANVLQQVQSGGGPQQQAIFYSMPAGGGRPVPVLPPSQPTSVALGGAQYAATATGGAGVSAAGVAAPQQQVTSTSAVNQHNGVVGHEDLAGLQQTANTSVGHGQQPLVSTAGSPPIQNNNANIPVAGLKPVVLAQQQQAGVTDTVVGLNDVTSNNQNVGVAGIQAFQQSALIQQGGIIQSQQHVQQHQSHPQQQRLVNVTQGQQNVLQSHIPQNNAAIGANIEAEEKINNNTSLSNDVRASLGTGSPSGTVPEAPIRRLHMPVQPMQNIDDFKTINEQQQQEKYEAAKQQQQQQNEPKTYANLFKSTSSSPSGFVNAALQQQQQQLQQQQLQQQQQASNSIFQSSNITSSSYTNQSNNNSTNSSISTYNRNGGLDGNGGPMPQRNNKFTKDFDRRLSNAQIGDHQQLFLGNIPLHATEDDLKTIFSRFGTILELRILSKAGARIPLNYGFITYEDSDAVQKCLASCPIYFPENSPDGQKLNVEEKKPRMRAADLPPRQGMGNSINNSNMNSAQRNMGGGGVNTGGNGPRSLSGGGGSGNTGGSGGNTGGGMIRSNVNNNMQRGSAGGGGGGGPRLSGGAFNRNENRNNGPTNGGGGLRGNNNSQSSGGGNYGRR